MSAMLKILAFLALSGLPASGAGPGVGEVVARASSCATGVHIIVARASGEAPGEGIIGSVASSVVKQIAGSDSEAVPYPATLDSYPQSEGYGTGNMTQLLKAYVNRCSSSKIVLMGYSQGAQVTLDTLCGTTDGSEFTSTPPLSSPYSKNVVAVVAMGDPSHVPGKTWDVGTSTKQGYFPRTGNGCNPFASLIQSYCDFNDTFCDSGSSLAVHQSYVKKYGNQAASFVVSKWKASQ